MSGRLGQALLLLALGGCAARPVAPGPATTPPPAGGQVVPPPAIIVDAHQFLLSGAAQQGALLTGTAPRDTALLLLDGKPLRFAPDDGRFIIAFDRDAPATALLEARMQDGRLLRLTIPVAPRQWDISYLPTLLKGTSPTPEYQAIRAVESAQIAAAKTANSDSDGWRGPFRWPAIGRISTLFGSQRIYAGGVAGAYHSGIDIAKPVDGAPIEGTPALAPADGVVTLTTDHPFSLEGNLVMIDHGFGLISALMHLQRIDVHAGDRVRRGDPIGLIGMTGRATGPHLHWGMTWNGARIDPLLVAGPMPSPSR